MSKCELKELVVKHVKNNKEFYDKTPEERRAITEKYMDSIPNATEYEAKKNWEIYLKVRGRV